MLAGLACMVPVIWFFSEVAINDAARLWSPRLPFWDQAVPNMAIFMAVFLFNMAPFGNWKASRRDWVKLGSAFAIMLWAGFRALSSIEFSDFAEDLRNAVLIYTLISTGPILWIVQALRNTKPDSPSRLTNKSQPQ